MEMKNKKIKQNGFMLMFVVVVIGFVGIMMSILAANSNAMLFEANSAYVEACRRNLAAGGLAWAKKTLKNDAQQKFNEAIELDVGKMDIRNSSLTVTISAVENKEAEVKINTSCSYGRQNLKGDDKYRIRL